MHTSTSFTLGKAARETGKSKTTILRTIKSGKITASQDEDGTWRIEPAELFRHFERVAEDEERNGSANRSVARSDTPQENTPEPPRDRDTPRTSDDTPSRNSALQAEVEALRERMNAALLEQERVSFAREREQLCDQIDFLRRSLDEERGERQRLTALLTVEPSTPPDTAEARPKRRRFLGVF